MKTAVLFILLATVAPGLAAIVPHPRSLAARAAPPILPIGTTWNQWTAVGCWQDTFTQPQLLGVHTYIDQMKPGDCSNYCSQGGYRYMGLSYGVWCYCDNSLQLLNGAAYLTTPDKCNMTCQGDATFNGGGVWTNAMFELSTAYPTDLGASFSASSYSTSSSLAAYSASYSASVSASASRAAYSAAQTSLAAYSASASLYSYSSSSSASVAAASAAAAGAAAAAAAAIAASASTSASLAAYSASVSAASAAAAAASAAAGLPSGWSVAPAACISEGTSGRALTGSGTSAGDMSPSKCLGLCAQAGFAIAGLEYGSECYCGNALLNGASINGVSTKCTMPCSGASSAMCGGPGAISLFVQPLKLSKTLNLDLTPNVGPNAVPTLPTGWSAATPPCIAEGSSGRALTGASTNAPNMTPTVCANFCASKGFQWAATEYATECYCGNSFSNGGGLSRSSVMCTMPCAGDASAVCGGPGALSLYNNPAITLAAGSGGAGGSGSGPISGTLPTGWNAASAPCIQEVGGRALTGAQTSSQTMTVSTCLNWCSSKGFSYAGLEYSAECFCGSALTNGASLTSTSSSCSMPCAGDNTLTCGGPNAIQLYINPNAAAAAPQSTIPSVVNGYSYIACIQEVNGRALTGMSSAFNDNSYDKCTTTCKNAGFKFAGVEYGSECFCGNGFSNGASTSLTSTNCNMPCSGNSTIKCGGPNAINLFIAR